MENIINSCNKMGGKALIIALILMIPITVFNVILKLIQPGITPDTNIGLRILNVTVLSFILSILGFVAGLECIKVNAEKELVKEGV